MLFRDCFLLCLLFSVVNCVELTTTYEDPLPSTLELCCNSSNVGKGFLLDETETIILVFCPFTLPRICTYEYSSCSEILEAYPGVPSGYYYIQTNNETRYVNCKMEECLSCEVQNSKKIFETDLSSGSSFIASGSQISYVSTLSSSSVKCGKQGVIRITYPQPLGVVGQTKFLQFDLYFDTVVQGFNINIGDSLSNNGYGGDAGQTSNAAEVHSKDTAWLVYSNTLPGYQSNSIDGHLLIDQINSAISEHVTVTIGDEYVDFDNHEGIKKCYKSPYLFTLNGQTPTYGSVNYDIYFGMNRVISSSSRSGTGLCRAVIMEYNCV